MSQEGIDQDDATTTEYEDESASPNTEAGNELDSDMPWAQLGRARGIKGGTAAYHDFCVLHDAMDGPDSPEELARLIVNYFFKINK